jgi:large subunit ribosomal protein L25
MSNVATFAATVREQVGKGAARATRRSGLVPGVIYGDKQAPVAIAIDPRIIWSELNKPGFKTRLFSIDLDNAGNHKCLARDVQFHPVTDRPIHVDFLRVSKDSVVHVKVPVHCINHDRSPGIKRGGVLNIEHHEIEVTCSPDHIPSEYVIDLSGYEIGASLHLSHVVLGEGVQAYHLAAEATIVTIAPPTVGRGDAAAAAVVA